MWLVAHAEIATAETAPQAVIVAWQVVGFIIDIIVTWQYTKHGTRNCDMDIAYTIAASIIGIGSSAMGVWTKSKEGTVHWQVKAASAAGPGQVIYKEALSAGGTTWAASLKYFEEAATRAWWGKRYKVTRDNNVHQLHSICWWHDAAIIIIINSSKEGCYRQQWWLNNVTISSQIMEPTETWPEC